MNLGISALRFASLFVLFQLPAHAFDKSSCPDGWESYEKLKIKDKHVAEIPQKTHQAESPVVSDDETMITWVANPVFSKFVPPTDVYSRPIGEEFVKPARIKKGFFGLLNIFVKSAYTPDGGLLTAEMRYRFGAITRSTISYFRTHDWAPVGYYSTITLYEGGARAWTLDPSNFKLPMNVALEHPRLSPDKEWLTFYIQSSASSDGIYLYNMKNHETTRLTTLRDKHPTWSGDGQRIFFHREGNQTGTNAEIGEIGYFQVELRDGKVVSSNRIVIADENALQFGEEFIYEKHPAFHTGLNLVFFHAQKKADGKKFIGVRDLDHLDKKPLQLDLEYNGQKLKNEKHPDVSPKEDSNLYFVAKLDGDKDDRLFMLDFKALQKIKKKFNGEE